MTDRKSRKPMPPLDRALWCAMTDWLILLAVAVLIVAALHPTTITVHDIRLGY